MFSVVVVTKFSFKKLVLASEFSLPAAVIGKDRSTYSLITLARLSCSSSCGEPGMEFRTTTSLTLNSDCLASCSNKSTSIVLAVPDLTFPRIIAVCLGGLSPLLADEESSIQTDGESSLSSAHSFATVNRFSPCFPDGAMTMVIPESCQMSFNVQSAFL